MEEYKVKKTSNKVDLKTDLKREVIIKWLGSIKQHIPSQLVQLQTQGASMILQMTLK